MLRIALFSLFSGLLVIAPSAHAASNADTCRTYSSAFMKALENGNYAAATTHFNAKMKAAASAQILAQFWQSLPTKNNLGSYEHAGSARLIHYGSAVIVDTPLQFTHGRKILRVACDASGNIEGFFIRPAPPEMSKPGKTAPSPSSANEQPLAVSSPYGPLPGTLTLPAGKGPFPAVLLVAGSGPENQDETLGPNKPFRDIALGLAAGGIASLRYDKRTYSYPRQVADNPNVTVDDVTTDDALTALRELARQKSIDTQRLFVLGHSLGAMMAPRIGQRDPHLDGLILMAAPTSFSLETVVGQLRRIARVEKWSAAQLKQQLAPIVKARKALAEANPAHPPSGLFFHAPASFWLSLRSYHPIATAKRLSEPLLILQGGSDYQVTPKNDFARWRAAFAHNPRVKLIEFTGLDHLFIPVSPRQSPSPAEELKPGHVDARVIHAIVAWIRAQPATK